VANGSVKLSTELKMYLDFEMQLTFKNWILFSYHDHDLTPSAFATVGVGSL